MKLRSPWLLRLAALAVCTVLPTACDGGVSSTPLETGDGNAGPEMSYDDSFELGAPTTPKAAPPAPARETSAPAAGSASTQGGGGSEPAENPPVPEPTTFLLVGAGLAALAMFRGRKRSAQEQIEQA